MEINPGSVIPNSSSMQIAAIATHHLDGRERISRNPMSQSIAERKQMPTVLIVEDDSNIRQFVAVNLKARGYTVLQAENAEDGLQQLREHTPGALVLDIKLPGMSGWDMLVEINADPSLSDIPVIIMTASPLSDHPSAQTYANIADKLVKPVSTVDLMLAIRKACG